MRALIPTQPALHVFAVFLTTAAFAADRLVPSQYPTNQAAIDAASPGDGHRNIFASFCLSAFSRSTSAGNSAPPTKHSIGRPLISCIIGLRVSCQKTTASSW